MSGVSRPSKDRSADNPRVLVLTKGLGLGGAESLITQQVTRRASVDFEVAYIRPDKTHFVPAINEAGASAKLLRRPWPWSLWRLLLRRRPDVVHSHSPLMASLARVLLFLDPRLRAPSLYTEHNRWSNYRLLTQWANCVTMSLDRTVWAVSEEARSSVWPRALRERVVTLHHGVDLVALRQHQQQIDADAARRSLGARPDDIVLASVANVRPAKAHDVLLDAFDVAAAATSRLRLVLAGQGLDGPIAARIHSSPVKERITVLGKVPDGAALIATADALVLSSRHEGLPLVVMEALALGRPVVATAAGGVPELVKGEASGLLSPIDDAAALAESLIRLEREDGLLERLSGGAAEAGSRFDGSRAFAQIEAAYREVATGIQKQPVT